MSKHRHKSRERNNNMNGSRFNNGPMNNYPFGINPQQLLAMLGNNMDIGGLNNILSSMNREGFDLNSFNKQMGNMNMGANPMGNMGDSFNVNNVVNDDIKADDAKSDKENHTKTKESDTMDMVYDENIEFLQSLRTIVSPSKIELIDKMIELYNKGAFKDK